MDQTFKNNAGVGNYLDFFMSAYTIGNPFNYSRIVYDNLFLWIVVILLIEILSGIIIDTFASIRERQENIQKDINNNCFICGMRRDEIEKLEKNKNAF
jgi:hypothetical protein